MRRILIILILMGLTDATIQLDPGVTYDCENTDYNFSATTSETAFALYPNMIQINTTNFTVVPNSGSQVNTIHPFNDALRNFTEDNSLNANVTHNLTGLKASTKFNTYLGGVQESQITSDGAGTISYITGNFTGQNNVLLEENIFFCTYRNGSTVLYSTGLGNINATLTFYNTNKNTVLNCTLKDLDGWCNYGGTNLTSIRFPANITQTYTACDINLYSGNKTNQNVSIFISEDQYLNRTNLGSMNDTSYLRRYYQ